MCRISSQTGDPKQNFDREKRKQGSQGIDDCSFRVFRFAHTSLCHDLLVKFLRISQLFDDLLIAGYRDYNRALQLSYQSVFVRMEAS